MKKTTVAFILVLLLLGGYFAFDTKWGKAFFEGIFSGESAIVNRMSMSFLEDIRFKDYENAASYHHPEDREKTDIPKLIKKKFRIKPELLDIMDYRILETTLDSSGTRARVKMKAKTHLLNTDKIKHAEFILYYYKRDEAWYMELESSLK